MEHLIKELTLIGVEKRVAKEAVVAFSFEEMVTILDFLNDNKRKFKNK